MNTLNRRFRGTGSGTRFDSAKEISSAEPRYGVVIDVRTRDIQIPDLLLWLCSRAVGFVMSPFVMIQESFVSWSLGYRRGSLIQFRTRYGDSRAVLCWWA